LKKNGDEAGVDCGGSCRQICDFQRPEPVILWSRINRVVPGVYNATAYVENTNLDVGVPQASYSFRLYDETGILVAERQGVTFVPPSKTFAIFEGGIESGERIATRVNFEFTSPFIWRTSENRSADIVISNKRLTEKSGLPRAEAEVKNISLAPFSDLELVAIVYRADGNAINFSRTTIDFLDKGAIVPVVFTWPEVFTDEPARLDILVRSPLN